MNPGPNSDEGVPPPDDPPKTVPLGPKAPAGDRGTPRSRSAPKRGAGVPTPRGSKTPKPAGRTVYLPPDKGVPDIPGVSILAEIGRGGMGVVFRGVQVFLKRTVAVKMLNSASYGRDFERRFQREARILAGLAHPNIVSCYQAGVTTAGEYYLVMEFIDGPSLRQHLNRHGAVSTLDALHLCREVAVALRHAHESDIIHRDVKPENILLQNDEYAPATSTFPYRAKLADLGLARPMTSDSSKLTLTAPGAVMGTPATMAPEQFEDPDSVDWRADAYALGCILFHAVTGEMAFPQRSIARLMAEKHSPVQPDAHRIRPTVPERVAEFAKSLYAPQKDLRPGSYDDIVSQLDELIRLEHASPPVRRRSASRRWYAAGFGGAALCAGAWFLLHRGGQDPPDNAPPRFEKTALPRSVPADGTCHAVVPDFREEAKATDGQGVVELEQSPRPGTLVGLGATPITLTALGSSGTTATLSTTFEVVDTTPPSVASWGEALRRDAGTESRVALPDFTAQVVAKDACTNARVEQTPPAGTLVEAGTTRVTLRALDAAGNVATNELTFTLEQAAVLTEPKLVLEPPGAVLREGATAVYSVADTADSRARLDYTWSVKPVGIGPAVALQGSRSSTLEFQLPQAEEDYALEVTVQATAEGGQPIEPLRHTLSVTVDHRPSATVTKVPERVEAGETVVLKGVGEDRDADSKLTYRWQRTSPIGPEQLEGENAATLTFVAPEAQEDYALAFEFTVDDGTKRSAPAPATLSVDASPELRPLPAGAVLDLLAGVTNTGWGLPKPWSEKEGVGLFHGDPELPDCVVGETREDLGVQCTYPLPRGKWTLEGWVAVEQTPFTPGAKTIAVRLDCEDGTAVAVRLTRTAADTVMAEGRAEGYEAKQGWTPAGTRKTGTLSPALEARLAYRMKWTGAAVELSLANGPVESFPCSRKPRKLVLQVRGGRTIATFGGLRLRGP